MRKSPFFSIITVSYNSAETIEKTILSVLNQTYKNFEYIIIDGGSTDETVNIIKKYQDKITYWISEKDRGVYNAMNKGIDIANGNYLNFMNSDDYFYSENILEEIIPLCDKGYSIIYGNTEIRHKTFNFIRREPAPKYLWMGPVNHQSSFIKREIMQRYRYNEDNRLIAEYEFFLEIYYNEGRIFHTNKIIASFYSGGMHQINDVRIIKDSYKCIKKWNNSIFIKIYYEIMQIKPVLKKILPIPIFKFLRSKIFN